MYAPVENNPGIEYAPVTRGAETISGFRSAVLTPIQNRGMETMGDGDAPLAVRAPDQLSILDSNIGSGIGNRL